jgi:hypothetical protein
MFLRCCKQAFTYYVFRLVALIISYRHIRFCSDIQRHNGLIATIIHYFSQTFCAKALPAADLEALIVLPSFSIFDADGAAVADFVFLGGFSEYWHLLCI